MKFTHFLLMLPALVLADTDVDTGDLEGRLTALGTPGLDVYDYSYTTTVDENEQYTLEVKFFHDPSFPVGSPDTCSPLEVAADGLGYLANRWYYEAFDEKTKLATGFDHVSIDYNACGHPPGGFLQPHYDVHLYTVTPEDRLSLTCDLLSSAPICDFNENAQTTESGRAFFEVARAEEGGPINNMPMGFDIDVQAAVQYMGTHVFHPDEAPATPANWTDPVLVYCTHGAPIIAFESMFPWKFNHGDEDHFWDRTIEMENQDIDTLPTYHSVAYDAATGLTTLVVKGKSALSKTDFEEETVSTPSPVESSVSPPLLWLSGAAMVFGALSIFV